MKKCCLFLSVYACLCLLAACGAAQSGPVEAGDPPPEPVRAVITCRAVTVEDSLLLAGADGDPNIYTASLKDTSGIQPGALVEIIYDGTVQETYPAQFSGVSAAAAEDGGFDDLCVLYLRVLEDLWAVDPGLNSDGLTYIGVDLSQTSLTESEQAAVAWAFAARHGGELVTGTWEELADQGYIDKEHLQWEDGILFTIAEKPVFGSYGLKPVAFDAQKWRSGTGAYFFSSCTATQAEDGHWGDYSVGSEAIS